MNTDTAFNPRHAGIASVTRDDSPDGVVATSVSAESGRAVTVAEVKAVFSREFSRIFSEGVES